jgi:translation initiation factor 1
VKKNSSVVYSTDPDYQSTCPACLERMNACRCAPKPGSFRNPNPVEIRRETKGRGGKAVTVVMQAGGDLKGVLKDLQKLCGVGGTVKQKTIELQGDHRDKAKGYFEGKGRKVKFTGG